MIGRRTATRLLAGAAVWPLAARAQQSDMARVGWLTLAANPQIDAFRAGMRDLGYDEGRNLTIEHRDAGGRRERLADLAADLDRMKVDVVVAIGSVAARATRDTMRSVPIVFVTNEPVSAGLVDSLARPGGNNTGLVLMSADIASKWLELICELLPGATRFIALVSSINSGIGTDSQVQSLLAASGSLGKQVSVNQARNMEDLTSIFEAAARRDAQGMLVLSAAIFHGNRQRIVDLAAKYHVPGIYEHRDFADAGGLISYGPDISVAFRRIAYYVDRVLKGAKPADLPVEQPTRFELVINLKTANTLGIAVPPSLLARADVVIE